MNNIRISKTAALTISALALSVSCALSAGVSAAHAMGSAVEAAVPSPEASSQNGATPKGADETADVDQALDALFDAYWAYELKEDPFLATSTGVNEFNHLTPMVTPADHARRASAHQGFLDQLNAMDLTGASPSKTVSADLLRFILKHDVALAPYKTWRAPFLSDFGFHMRMGFVVGATPFRNETDYETYLTRLEAFPAYLDQNVENMRLGIAEGFTQPSEIMEGILPSFDAQAQNDFISHPLFKPFTAIPDSIPPRKARDLRQRGETILRETILPAYQRVATFMRETYTPAAAPKVGALHQPNGDAYYRALVQYYTTLDDATPEAIHDLGLREVARIRAEMDDVIAQTGFEGDFEAFLEFLRTDERFYAKSSDELLKEVTFIAKDIDGKLPKLFGKLPRQPYSVEPVPAEIAPNYTSGRYVGAPADSDRGGQYWVNTYALHTRPLYEYVALSLHEAMPGHHLQGALSLEIENAPAFRREFYPHAFGEGWGLYSEKLGVELGVYRDPYDHFGRLSFEMWRAARLVIDTGLHSKGWDRQQAIDYLASNTALSLHNVTTEIDRYIAWPGQALAYKMGELTIWELRAKAEKELGDQFDIRAFHDEILAEGGLPLVVLRQRIDAYIARERKK